MSRSLGTTSIAISPIIMGTWQAGKQMWVGIDDDAIQHALRGAFDAGITTFDTAEMYGSGHSERAIGRALAGVRDKIVLLSKVAPQNLAYDRVIRSCEASLTRLQTDYIDLYQIHWPPGSFNSPKVDIEQPMRALCELRERGKIRAIGVSNFSRGELEQAASYGRIDAVQPPYSLFWRQIEDELLPYCREQKITVLAYSPLAQGLLTGKFGPEHKFAAGDHRSKSKLFSAELYPRVQAALAQLAPIAEQKNVTLGQLALAWVISHPNTCAIAGARNADQVRQNAAASRITLSRDELRQLDEISRRVTAHLTHDPMLWTFGR